ncbi:MAG: Arc/MetJ-type ribon-helix-helix transcriptional regulator [Bradymonadia bacterium]|jgi:Arc/MetJ-type ribon-helix-helix transcriptional regulator
MACGSATEWACLEANVSVQLTKEQAELLEESVKLGEFDSPEEALDEAIRTLGLRRSRLLALQAEVEEGIADLEAGRISEASVDEIIATAKKRRGL